jgi:glycosyltransferase involved in cell wall biosynthesis
MKKSCGFFTNIAPLYSRPLWLKLSNSSNVEYVFYSSRKGYSGIKTIDISESKYIKNDAQFNWLFLKNIYIRNILFYQIGAAYKCLTTNYCAYIFNAEAQCISNWFAAIICRLRKKPVMFWGHGLHGNEKRMKKSVQLFFYRLADYHLIYGNRSRLLMIKSGFNPEILYTVYNSLDFEAHIELYASRNLNDLEKFKKNLFPESSINPVVIFIGRLTKEKKIHYLLQAINLCKSRDIRINCLIVGGGTESDSLKKLSLSLGLEKSVCFFGPSYDEKINAQMIMIADCCVSPGNVGLTAIHSMSLGTPVITHGNLSNQGPEAEAIIEKKTGLLFDENNVQSLSATIENLIFNIKKSSMEANCIEHIKEFWNPINQASIFDIVVRKAIVEKC